MFALMIKLKACADLKVIFAVSPSCPLVITFVELLFYAPFDNQFHSLQVGN
jgi:hypothetical protein